MIKCGKYVGYAVSKYILYNITPEKIIATQINIANVQFTSVLFLTALSKDFINKNKPIKTGKTNQIKSPQSKFIISINF
jgi:hypothetical protein